MNEELVTYEVELDSPDFFVSFQAEKGLSLDQIEFLAIQEMTRNTRVWNVNGKSEKITSFQDFTE